MRRRGGTPAAHSLIESPIAETRLEWALEWLLARPPAEEVLILAPSRPAAHELLRVAADRRGAAFGWHRATLGRLASDLVAGDLAREERVPVGRLACVAIVARVVQELGEEGGLGRYAAVASGPTFARAATATIQEVRLARLALLAPEALEEVDPSLRALVVRYEEALQKAGLIDRAGVLERATERLADAEFAHPLLGLPTLLVDVPLASEVEGALVAAIASRSAELVATTPSGDTRTRERLVRVAGLRVEPLDVHSPASSLARLQMHLFEDRTSDPASLGDDVVVLSAPGESRECVEIARRLLGYAAEGVPFDRMAVLLRSVEEYRPHLEEALQRAAIPAYFAQGATRPDPAGRAFFALLACRAESFSARRFAEYLSLGEVPPAGDAGTPPVAPPSGDRWVGPDEELVPEAVAAALVREQVSEQVSEPVSGGVLQDNEEAADPDVVPVVAGSLRAPRHWERLLVESSVIGGRDRWQRRLKGLAESFRLELREIDDSEDPTSQRLSRDLEALESLGAFALPLIDALVELPDEASPRAAACTSPSRMAHPSGAVHRSQPGGVKFRAGRL